MRARRLTALTLLAALTMTACQPADPETPAATLRPTADAPAPTPTPTPSPSPTEESFAPPDPIDAAYAQRVLNRLYQTEGDANRAVLSAGEVTPQVEALVDAVASPDWAQAELEGLRLQAAEDFPNLRRPPGDSSFRVDRLVTAREECLYVVGLKDFSQVTDPALDRTGQADFVWLTADDEPSPFNPTGWVVAAMRTRSDGGEETDPCA